MSCSHTQQRYTQEYDEDSSEYITVCTEVSTNVDINIGRFRCTQCHKIGYYTGNWRNFYEKE